MHEHSETVAVVSGGTQGLGLAIAEHLLAEECTQIVIAGHRVPEGEAAAEGRRRRGAEVLFVPADMGRVEDATALVDSAVERFGRVTALVNAAATTERGSILETSPDASGLMTGALVDFDQNVAGADPE